MDTPSPNTSPPSLHDALPISLAGEPFRFVLADALRKGPVVLYFYPKAFTKGCTIEANRFAEAAPHYADLGATVRSEEHTSELQSRENLVCRLLLEKKKWFRVA